MCVNSEGFSARQNNLKFKTVYVLLKWADLGSFRIPRSVRLGCVMTTPLGKETSMLRCLLAKQSPGTCGFYYTGYWLRICIVPLLRYTVAGHKGKLFPASFCATGDTEGNIFLLTSMQEHLQFNLPWLLKCQYLKCWLALWPTVGGTRIPAVYFHLVWDSKKIESK